MFEVTMRETASAAEAGRVPATMAKDIAWTSVSLTLTVPALPGRARTTVSYNGTFDQQIPIQTSTSVATGLERIASTPHVARVQAEIPQTMRVDAGSLTIGADTDSQAALDTIRTAVSGTVFKDTTIHGSFGNGAKP